MWRNPTAAHLPETDGGEPDHDPTAHPEDLLLGELRHLWVRRISRRVLPIPNYLYFSNIV